MAEVHKGEAIVPAKANPNNQNSQNNFAGLTNLDKAINKMADVLSKINIPEKITVEIGTLVHEVRFNGGDALTENIAQRVAERAGEMMRKQLNSVISPVDGSILIG
jgi:hypothetical protein